MTRSGKIERLSWGAIFQVSDAFWKQWEDLGPEERAFVLNKYMDMCTAIVACANLRNNESYSGHIEYSWFDVEEFFSQAMVVPRRFSMHVSLSFLVMTVPSGPAVITSGFEFERRKWMH